MDAATKAASDEARARKRAQGSATYLRQLIRWHWISAAICLIGMLLFAVTGVTLNHAADIPASARTVERRAVMPAAELAAVRAAQASEGALPRSARSWLNKALKVGAAAGPVEWSEDEAYLDLPGPGADATLSIDLASGETAYERTERGWIAYLNDLHKGRNTGPAWSWFIDVFAAGCIVFCVTGLLLLQRHAWARRSTWPLVGAGLLIPLLLALFLIH